MAWYQSEVQADQEGNGSVRVRTILLDQIFGFDPDVSLQPTWISHHYAPSPVLARGHVPAWC
jgi:hypothetical protein